MDALKGANLVRTAVVALAPVSFTAATIAAVTDDIAESVDSIFAQVATVYRIAG